MSKSSSVSIKIRAVALMLAVLGVASYGTTKLMKYQIVNGSALLEEAQSSATVLLDTTAARGDIVDRYGRVLATSTSVYNVVFNYSFTEKQMLNTTIEKLITLMKEQNLEWQNYTPIEIVNGQYAFTKDSDNAVDLLRSTIRQASYSNAADCVDKMYSRYDINTKEKINTIPIDYVDGEYKFADVSKTEISEFKSLYHLDQELSASDCIEKLQKDKVITLYTEQEAFEIALVRYSMEYKQFSANNQYLFAEDVTNETILKVKEQGYKLSGVDIINEPVREYVNGTVASHLLGTVGPIYAEEYDEYKENYPMDAIVGKSGIESAFEDVLRGTDGVTSYVQNANGEIIQEKVVTSAKKGDTLHLTIDSMLQTKIQTLLSDFVSIKSTNNGKYDSTGGAVVVLDRHTGEVIAAVTEPTYSIEDYKQNYSELLEPDVTNLMEKKNPLLNKAINGQYRPGSTFKPVIATAGLVEGEITPTSTLRCVSPFNYYGTDFGCLQINHSGPINVITALKWSCNTFFYQLGDTLGLEKLAFYANALGLGVDTGLEIYQEIGKTTEYTDDDSWYIGKIIQAAIGQADTYVTPIQMACEAMTVGNEGTRYETHIIDKIVDANDVVTFETEPVIASQLDMTDEASKAVIEGMIEMGKNLTGSMSVMDLPYDVGVKTGTPQTIDDYTTNNAFIAFTDEIAIACMIENCDIGVQALLRPIIDAYDEGKQAGALITEESDVMTVAQLEVQING